MVGVAGLALASAACGRAPEATAPHRPRVALVMKSLANEFFLTMEKGARDHQAKNAARYDLLASGIKDELDVNAQATLVEQMIAQKVDAIVLAPADSKALVAACKRAVDAGIAVVNIDNRLDAAVLAERGLRIPFVGPDNRKGARRVGEYLAGKLQKGRRRSRSWRACPRPSTPSSASSASRTRSRPRASKLVASQSGDWEMAKANQVAAALLGEHPQLKALLCANDNMALGAVAARKAAGQGGQRCSSSASTTSPRWRTS